MLEKKDKSTSEKYFSLMEKSLIEKYAPDAILKLIEENKMTYDDIGASYQFYTRLFKFIDLNFDMHLKYETQLLCDMYKTGEYSDYLKTLDVLGVEYRHLFSK